MRFPCCLLAAASANAMLLITPSVALDMPPPDVQRAGEYGAAATASAQAFDGNPIDGIVFVRESTYRVWSESCSAEVKITYAFDELDPLSPPDANAEVRNMRCGKQK